MIWVVSNDLSGFEIENVVKYVIMSGKGLRKCASSK